MPDKPVRGETSDDAVVRVRTQAVETLVRSQTANKTGIDLQMQRAGALRLTLFSLFAFIYSFRRSYKVILEFGGGNHIEVTAAPLMRVRVVARGTLHKEDDV